jgi:dephospho-CoA kinase
MLLIGLTGSIGMGKSTTAAMFAARGVPVHDSDAAVHALYVGAAAPLIEAEFPGTTTGGVVDRARLSTQVVGNADAMRRLEAIVHPLVRGAERSFRHQCARAGHRCVVLDIPLLFETGSAGRVDLVVVVSAPESVQKARVMARPGMTDAKFAAIVAKQLPDRQKRRQAHWVIETGNGLDHAAAQVSALLRATAALNGSDGKAP